MMQWQPRDDRRRPWHTRGPCPRDIEGFTGKGPFVPRPRSSRHAGPSQRMLRVTDTKIAAPGSKDKGGGARQAHSPVGFGHT